MESTLGGSKKSCNTKFQNCLGKSEAVDKYVISNFLSLTSVINQPSPFLPEYKMILTSAFRLNSLWYGSSVFPWDQFVLICPPFLLYFLGVLGSRDGRKGAALKARAQLVTARKRSVLLRLKSWSSLTLSYTILTDREILILWLSCFLLTVSGAVVNASGLTEEQC